MKQLSVLCSVRVIMLSERSTRLAALTLVTGCAVAGQAGSPGVPDSSSQGSPDAAISSAGSDAASGSCMAAFTGVLATWTLASEPGSQSSTPAATSATAVTAGSLQRATTLSTATGAGSMNSSNWSTATHADTSKYYSMKLSAQHGCVIDVSSLAVDIKSSSTGPAMAEVRSSADGYAQTATVTPNTVSAPSLTISDASDLELRVFGYAATSTAGTMRIQNTLTISGSVH